MNDKELRKNVKLLKATDSIKSYTELAEMLEMSRDSFYNWLRGYYDFGAAKKERLKGLISDLYIPL